VTDGTIKRVISERGFGFIAAEDGKEYFFHRNELGESLDFDRLAGGEAVSFDVEASPKGPRAVRPPPRQPTRPRSRDRGPQLDARSSDRAFRLGTIRPRGTSLPPRGDN
jgi:CspA family cold shock protein